MIKKQTPKNKNKNHSNGSTTHVCLWIITHWKRQDDQQRKHG